MPPPGHMLPGPAAFPGAHPGMEAGHPLPAALQPPHGAAGPRATPEPSPSADSAWFVTHMYPQAVDQLLLVIVLFVLLMLMIVVVVVGAYTDEKQEKVRGWTTSLGEVGIAKIYEDK